MPVPGCMHRKLTRPRPAATSPCPLGTRHPLRRQTRDADRAARTSCGRALPPGPALRRVGTRRLTTDRAQLSRTVRRAGSPRRAFPLPSSIPGPTTAGYANNRLDRGLRA